MTIFEYHCLESRKSADAELWYRSHQRVTVLECVNEDQCGDMTADERAEAGMPLVFTILFNDGYTDDAFEDELLSSVGEYQRPDPPEKPG